MKKKLLILACLLTLGAVAAAFWLVGFWNGMGDYSWSDDGYGENETQARTNL